MLVEISEGIEFVRQVYDKEVFDIQFRLNPTVYQLQHNALDWVDRHKLVDTLIENVKFNRHHLPFPSNEYIFVTASSASLNEEQKMAAENIVKSASFPSPYLLFGPPG